MQNNNFEKVLGRSAIGAVFCSLILLASMATAINISNSNEPEVIDSLSYTFLFEEPTAKLTEVNSQDFTLVEMKGCIGIGKTAAKMAYEILDGKKVEKVTLVPVIFIDKNNVSEYGTDGWQ